MGQPFFGRQKRGYIFGNRIGASAYSVIYEAGQVTSSRRVAIKVVLPAYASQAHFARRFEDETRLTIGLDHPHIVPVLDHWRDADGAYLVMPLYARSLKSLLNTHPAGLPAERVIAILADITRALTAAHELQIVHCDIKPDNVLLDDDERASLSDFGIASVSSDTPASHEWQGTPAYMAPEQIRGEPVTPATDIYALAIMAYEMLTGIRPFQAESAAGMMKQHIEMPLPPLKTHAEGLNQKLDIVLEQAAHKDAAARYTSAKAFYEAMRAVVYDDALLHTTPERALNIRDDQNPYRGLYPFTETDEALFFGRESQIDVLVEKLQYNGPRSHVLVLVGPAGSGKTSLLHAGLLPALRRGAVTGSETWTIVQQSAFRRPVDALCASLHAALPADVAASLKAALADENASFTQAVKRHVPEDQTLLLVLDSLDTLYAAGVSDESRARYIKYLLDIARDDSGRIRLLIALRAERMEPLLQTPGLGSILQQRSAFIAPMQDEEIERAITGPVARLGMSVDRDMIAACLADLRGEPYPLPLLQFMLFQAFKRRKVNSITLESYLEIGGVRRALNNTLEDIYDAADVSVQNAIRSIFTGLVRRPDGAPLIYLAPKDPPDARQHARDLFVEARVLIAESYFGGDVFLRVAHPLISRRWDRLRHWMDHPHDDTPRPSLRWRTVASLLFLLVIVGSITSVFSLPQGNRQLNSTSPVITPQIRSNARIIGETISELQSQIIATRARQVYRSGDVELGRALAMAAVQTPDVPDFSVRVLAEVLDIAGEADPIRYTVDELLEIAAERFTIRELTCEERSAYNVQPLCGG